MPPKKKCKCEARGRNADAHGEGQRIESNDETPLHIFAGTTFFRRVREAAAQAGVAKNAQRATRVASVSGKQQQQQWTLQPCVFTLEERFFCNGIVAKGGGVAKAYITVAHAFLLPQHVAVHRQSRNDADYPFAVWGVQYAVAESLPFELAPQTGAARCETIVHPRFVDGTGNDIAVTFIGGSAEAGLPRLVQALLASGKTKRNARFPVHVHYDKYATAQTANLTAHPNLGPSLMIHNLGHHGICGAAVTVDDGCVGIVTTIMTRRGTPERFARIGEAVAMLDPDSRGIYCWSGRYNDDDIVRDGVVQMTARDVKEYAFETTPQLPEPPQGGAPTASGYHAGNVLDQGAELTVEAMIVALGAKIDGLRQEIQESRQEIRQEIDALGAKINKEMRHMSQSIVAQVRTATRRVVRAVPLWHLAEELATLQWVSLENKEVLCRIVTCPPADQAMGLHVHASDSDRQGCAELDDF